MKQFLRGQDFISIDQISTLDQIKTIFSRADHMREVVEKKQVFEPLRGKSVAVLFYQPSTRTFSSFVAAAQRLGAYVTSIHGMEEFSSVTKGESLEDTMRSIYQTTGADAVVLRHPDDSSSQVAADASPVPIINAGSGKLEHPTQALLDLYTIYQHFKRSDNLHIVMVGDLLYGRTIKSLAKLLGVTSGVSNSAGGGERGKNKITFVSPDELRAPKEFVAGLSSSVEIEETDTLSAALKTADVVYMTRVQKEWFEKAGKVDEYEHLKDRFVLTRHMASQMPKKSIIMHPLPRVGEIMREVDDDPRARYFEQMRSGLYTRMALLDLILGE